MGEVYSAEKERWKGFGIKFKGLSQFNSAEVLSRGLGSDGPGFSALWGDSV